MGRPPVSERMGEPNRGPWTPDEDILLASYIQEHGPHNWRVVPCNAGLQRCGKSCQSRWKNYLRPGIKRGKFTFEEERVIIQYQALLGNRWAAIAAYLPGRTDNDIKNYWHNHLKNHEGFKHNGDAATSGLDDMKANCDMLSKNAKAGNSMIPTPQNEEESVYDDNGIPPLTLIEKWLLEDPSAPLPRVLSAPAPAAVHRVLSAPDLVVHHVLSAPASAAVSQVFPAPTPALVPQVFPDATSIEKWLLENTSAPVPILVPATISAPLPQVFPAWAPARFPQVPPALAPVPVLVPAPISAPLPQVLPAQAPACFPQVPPAPAPSIASGHEGDDHLVNMFTPFRHGQSSFSPFY